MTNADETQISISEIASDCGTSVKSLIAKAALLGITFTGNDPELTEVEAEVLHIIGAWKREKVKGFQEGIRVNLSALSITDIRDRLSQSSATETTAVSDPNLRNRVNALQRQVAELSEMLKVTEKSLEYYTENVPISYRNYVNEQSELVRNEVVQNSEAVREIKETGLASMERLEKSFSAVVSRCERVESEVAELRDGKESCETWTKLADRITSASVLSLGREKCVFPDPLPESNIRKHLSKNQLTYNKSTIFEILENLKRRHVIIVGRPGTGKTSLLKELGNLFQHKEEDWSSDYWTVDPEWTSYDMLGGKTIVDQRMAIHLGLFTESVMGCIETGKTTFLLMDEVNRAKPDDMFGGLMDSLQPQGASITMPEFRIMNQSVDRLSIPDNFRLVCTMNESDIRFLYPMSPQLQRRFAVVKIGKIVRDQEKQIYLDRLRLKKRGESVLKRIVGSGRKKNSSSEELVDALYALRGIEESDQFDTLFGTAYGLNAIDFVEGKLANEDYSDGVVDESIARFIIPEMLHLNREQRNAIITQVFEPRRLSKCATLLSL